MSKSPTDKERNFDLICLGRAGVDLYANQIGSRLEDVTSFNKYVGGSSTNIAFGAARLGLKTSMLTRVGDDHMGRFIREALQKEGCDTSQVITDPQRLTALVILGIKDKDTFPLIFYRENCADMAISKEDFDESFIASSKVFLVTGTHLSQQGVLSTAKQALEFSRANDVRTVLDIDYRPVLWGLTSKGDGETRFIASDNVSNHLQNLVGLFDLIVGTEEEFHIAGGSTDTIACLKTLRELTSATFVVKRGPTGCAVFEGDIPNHLDDGPNFPGKKVEVLNVLGAGDAFMSGLMYGWIRGEGWEAACEYANLCGGIVVSRHSCSPAMPSRDELAYYLKRKNEIPRPDLDTDLNRLHRVSIPRKEWKDLCIFAFDHRKQLVNLFNEFNQDPSGIRNLKNIYGKAFLKVAEELPKNLSAGVLADDTFGQDALNTLTGRGYWISRPVELPGSRPIELEGGRSIGSRLVSWPAEHIVKCLVFAHPDDDSDMAARQDRQISELYQACFASGHEFLLELISPSDMPSDHTTIPRLVKRYYEKGIYPDWWKLPAQTSEAWSELSMLINQYDQYCRGILILGLSAPIQEFEAIFSVAAKFPKIRGFAVGRSIFDEPTRHWLKNPVDEKSLINEIKTNFQTLCQYWNTK